METAYIRNRPEEALADIQKDVECEGAFLSDFAVEIQELDEADFAGAMEALDPNTVKTIGVDKAKDMRGRLAASMAKRANSQHTVIKAAKLTKKSASSKTFVAPSL